MALTTNYSSLQTNVADFLNRSDLSDAIKVFIQNAEGSLSRDPRVRSLTDQTLSVSAEDTALPSDFGQPESLYHDGSTYFGPLEIVTSDKLGELKGDLDLETTGVPAYAAFLGDGATLRVAPPPDQAYSLKFVYWRKVPRLSDASPTNWLLDDHPDIYLYAALVESAPYLKDDGRVPVWRGELDRRLEELHRSREAARFGGTLRVRPRQALD